ncbi:complement factor H-related protein 4-like isoform X2 [Carassius gibelio]|uniref:complement factor H-related protein 4-like isoform X2 n=1 Tax=Carassius gibelio TaxID=101364 RepID=UPI0022788857|nr:complement factor H-related protein 4-like isoform X2 [Carassius gibelio]
MRVPVKLLGFGFWLLSLNFAQCKEITCELKSTTSGVKKINPDGKIIFRAGESVEITFTCKDDGKWDNEPVCADKCGPPPEISNADTKEITNKEYKTEERVEYKCFDKYIMNLSPPFSKYLTCVKGEWKGDIYCFKPCIVTVEEMDKRGIRLRWKANEKMISPHDDGIDFLCQSGKAFRSTCKDGVMLLPECGE